MRSRRVDRAPMESTHGRLPPGVVVTARGEAGGLATRLVACCFAPAAPAERYGPAGGGGTGAGVVVLRLADSREARRELLGAAPASGPPPPMLRTEVVPEPSRRERTIARDAFLSYAVGYAARSRPAARQRFCTRTPRQAHGRAPHRAGGM